MRSLTNVPIDILRRDLEKEKNGQQTPANQKEKEQEVLTSRENGNIKAVKFILASLMHNKDYVDKKIDYQKLLARQSEIVKLAQQQIPLSSYYDYFDVDNNPLVKDCINYDFTVYQNSGQKYFEECVWLVASQILQERQMIVTNQFKQCSDLEQRQEIMKELSQITNNLRTKNLEEFYVK